VSEKFQPADAARFAAAIQRFDEENSRDPNILALEAMPGPRELVYSHWLSAWVLTLNPEASEELRLAARCQHLCRWMMPRENHPRTRAGYLQWREQLKKYHAHKAGEILREVGYPESVVLRVQALNLKRLFPHDEEARVLEDALCLVFLERQLGELAGKTSDEKVVNALRKSWRKMTPAAQAMAFTLPYGAKEKALLDRALGSTGESSR
jgi:hypothetical protein